MAKSFEVSVEVERRTITPAEVEMLQRADDYDWILFTSKNAVQFFVRELRERRIKSPHEPKIGAVGPVTAAALRAAHLRVDLMPPHFTAEDLIGQLGSVDGKRILLPRSAVAPSDAIDELDARGAQVDVLPLYSTEASPLSAEDKAALLRGQYHRLYFKSPSGVRGLLSQLSGDERATILSIPAKCIGPKTERAAKDAGFKTI